MTNIFFFLNQFPLILHIYSKLLLRNTKIIGIKMIILLHRSLVTTFLLFVYVFHWAADRTSLFDRNAHQIHQIWYLPILIPRRIHTNLRPKYLSHGKIFLGGKNYLWYCPNSKHWLNYGRIYAHSQLPWYKELESCCFVTFLKIFTQPLKHKEIVGISVGSWCRM